MNRFGKLPNTFNLPKVTGKLFHTAGLYHLTQANSCSISSNIKQLLVLVCGFIFEQTELCIVQLDFVCVDILMIISTTLESIRHVWLFENAEVYAVIAGSLLLLKI